MGERIMRITLSKDDLFYSTDFNESLDDRTDEHYTNDFSDSISEEIYRQLIDDYPPESLEWIKSTHWSGPEDIPESDINFSNMHTWTASREPEKVNKFMEKIEDGELNKPVLLVQTPSNTKMDVIDGHHRTLAYRALGRPVRAWIGYVNEEKGPWDEMHSSQYHGHSTLTEATPKTSRNMTVESSIEEHTGAMVALIPREDYLDKLVISGYEPKEELHVTLLYLGEASQWEENKRNYLRKFISSNFINIYEVNAEIHAHAVFNPQSDEPASVYIIGGVGALECEEFNQLIRSECQFYEVDIPNDHPFYLPHLTIGYGLDINKLTYTGPIVFDKIRMVFGADVTDIPLRPLSDGENENL